MLTPVLQTIRLPAEEDLVTKWCAYPLFAAATPVCEQMACHFSVLSASHCPHPPHQHAEEELLIILDGEAEIVIADGPSFDGARAEVLCAGSFVYYPARQRYHTIRNPGTAPITYLMFKWRGADRRTGQPRSPAFYHSETFPLPGAQGFVTQLIFEHPTAYLDKLHGHLTDLKTGAGYAPHTDAYDVAIVVLSGRIETIDRIAEPFDVIYYPADTPHGMRNAGTSPARYLVFEFHGSRTEQGLRTLNVSGRLMRAARWFRRGVLSRLTWIRRIY
jgi:quercetin dioxygenase-like cupin family protein